jgi:hypothetical protein
MKLIGGENSIFDLVGFTGPFFIIFALVILLVIFLGGSSGGKLL